MTDGKTTVVGAALAFGHSCAILQSINIIDRQHGRTFAVYVTFSGDQRSSKCPHDTCNIRANCIASGNHFKAAKNSIVIERTSLNNDVLTEFRGVRYFDYLK